MPANVKRQVLTVAGALLALASAAGAWAQGAFYREIAKDGRIYVFNNMQEFATFEKGGEIGKAITMLGYGPNGETLVADSVEAIHLYNFKHDRPGEVLKMAEQPAKPPKMLVAWKDGKTTIETDKALMNISNRIQLRFTQEMPDDATQLAGTPAKGDPRGSFRIRRAKFKLDGWFYKKNLQYEFQANWAELAGTAGNTVEDANINLDVKGDKRFMIKFGQFKVPFGRQELTSSGSQQFVDRSAVSNEYAKGRDMGLQLWGELKNALVDWRVGAFNGNGRLKTANDNDKYQYNARVTLQPFGAVKYEECDFQTTDKLLLAVAGNFEMNDFANVNTDKSKNIKRTLLGADLALLYRGLYLTGEFYDRKLEPEGPAKAGDPQPPSYKSNGYFAQAGYRFNPNWEVAARYGSWDPTDAKSDDDRTELGGAVSYYYNKHNMKIQADFRQIEDKAKKTKDNEVRLQTQFIF
jgi:hypothetical protein